MPFQVDVFVSGRDGYHTYRIPSLIATKGGTLLAFCEGRKKGTSDSGDIDLLLKRSSDGGKTWSAQEVLWDRGPDTCGNPCPVIDGEAGTIWLLLTHNLGSDREEMIIDKKSKGTRTVWVTRSEDGGKSWAAPAEITSSAKRPDWTWYATGPGVGIQLRLGPHRGRLIVPCDHMEAETKKRFSHVIYSDDRGRSWRLGGTSPRDRTNECQVVELRDGRLLLDMRNYDRGVNCRAQCTSSDGGLTWTDFRHVEALAEPICQASLIRHSPADAGGAPILLFSNPADEKKRIAMTVRLSPDDGATWPRSRLLHPGPSAYSSLAVLPDGSIACLFEAGEKGPYEKIVLARLASESIAGAGSGEESRKDQHPR